jgi:hypothetical protein
MPCVPSMCQGWRPGRKGATHGYLWGPTFQCKQTARGWSSLGTSFSRRPTQRPTAISRATCTGFQPLPCTPRPAPSFMPGLQCREGEFRQAMICERINLLILLPKSKAILQLSVTCSQDFPGVTVGPSSTPLQASTNQRPHHTVKMHDTDTHTGYLLETPVSAEAHRRCMDIKGTVLPSSAPGAHLIPLFCAMLCRDSRDTAEMTWGRQETVTVIAQTTRKSS